KLARCWPDPRRQRQSRQREQARHIECQCRAAGLLCLGDDTRRPADVQRTQQALSACVLVTRSGRHATQPGRQLEYTDARHQRPNLARRDPTTTWRASVRRSLSSACSRLTDIIVTSDHGFSTISKESLTSSTIKTKFADTLPGHLPLGFVALDLARGLNLPLIDPDDGYRAIGESEHTKNGNGLIGGDRNKPKVVVAANGGSDLIYIPDGDKATAKRVIDVLLAQDYVSGIFVDSKLGKFPGTLSLDDIALDGSAITPHPAIAISFRSFDTVCGEPVRCTVEVADTVLQHGQGMHGSFSGGDTWNFMAIQGPDFKTQFVDPAPASNADIGRTIAQLMR